MKSIAIIAINALFSVPALASERTGRPVFEKGRRNSWLGIGQISQKRPAI